MKTSPRSRNSWSDLECFERGLQRARGGRDGLELFGLKIVDVFVERLAGPQLVLDPVQHGHQHRRKEQVGVGRAVGPAILDPAASGAGAVDRNTNDGRAVAAAIRDLGGGLVARDQPLVAIGRGVRKSTEGRGVLDQAADGVDAQVRQARVSLAGQERLIVFPQGQVRVHSRAIVAEEGLGHEGRRLAVAASDVADDVLGRHDLVGTLDQRARDEVDLALARGGDLMKVGRRGDAAFGHALGHLGAQVHQAVGRRTGEVAQSRARLVAQVGVFGPTSVPCPFDGIDLVKGLVAPLVKLDVVEDEKLEFGSQQAQIGHTGVPHVADGLAGDVARVAGVVLVCNRIVDVADHRQASAAPGNGSIRAVSG